MVCHFVAARVSLTLQGCFSPRQFIVGFYTAAEVHAVAACSGLNLFMSVCSHAWLAGSLSSQLLIRITIIFIRLMRHTAWIWYVDH